ncbi:hypothetical protein [Methylobacterium radiotolerans]|uniref:hypothetical protein n=1 Tax=Methylobacterium radiotolerans TaxID=31998 RepID=UPI001F4620CF|nr:hypothetical protein [Methylobacterium radiotolerans]UIY45818.1 hypothetical protein LZ599_32445 [Methylobacterium radiotolerans]
MDITPPTKTYLVFLACDGRSLSEFIGEAEATSALEAAASVVASFEANGPDLEGGAYAVAADMDDLGDDGDLEAPETADIQFVSEDDIHAHVEAGVIADEDRADDSVRIDLNVGAADFEDGLRLACEGTFVYGGTPSARVGVYRRVQDGTAYLREATAVIPTRGRDDIGADTLRSYVENRLQEIEDERTDREMAGGYA